MKALWIIFVVVIFSSPLRAQQLRADQVELRWLTNQIRIVELKIRGATYTNATIRKAGFASVIVRHDGGFFSESITNIPRSIRTNLVYHPPREVLDYVDSNPTLNPITKYRLLRGEMSLSLLKEEDAWKSERAATQRREEAEREKLREAEREREERRQQAIQKRREAEDGEYFRTRPEMKKAISEQKIIVGMRMKDVVASWGEPDRKNETVNTLGRTAQWVYDAQDAYLYFNEEGLLRSWRISK